MHMKLAVFALLAMIPCLPAQAEYYKTPAGSKTLKGEDAEKLFRSIVGAGYEAKNLEKWREVKLITVSTGEINCLTETGSRQLDIDCSDSKGAVSRARSYLLQPIARRGSMDVRHMSQLAKVTDVTCTVSFKKEDEFNFNPDFKCVVKYPESSYDDAE